MELTLLALFALALLLCVSMDLSILYALGFGLVLFLGHGLHRRVSLGRLLHEAWTGILSAGNILIVMLLIGVLTGVWRACGTIAFIVYYASAFFSPAFMLLATFLLCGLLSTLIGSAFAAAATMGVICVTMANAMGIPLPFSAGAMLAGCFFGDRCSPMSTSALLVCDLTGTNIFTNIRYMVRTSLAPFAIACAVYLVLGLVCRGGAGSSDTRALFAAGFTLSPLTLLPALFIVALSLFRVDVKITIVLSVAAGLLLAFTVQGIPLSALPALLLRGFHPADDRLAALLSGGGILSMLEVFFVICLSSAYSGIFRLTGFLQPVQKALARLRLRVGGFAVLLLTAILTSVVSCNQTLATMLSYQICEELEKDKQRLAIDLENTVIVVPALIPWCIAASVPLAAVDAPAGAVLFACYLWLLPLWNLFTSLRREKERGKG